MRKAVVPWLIILEALHHLVFSKNYSELRVLTPGFLLDCMASPGICFMLLSLRGFKP
jgi:hypothetical protein